MLIVDTKENVLDKKYTLFAILVLIVAINIISSIHFLNILFIGFVFILYTKALAQQQYYLLIYIVLTILFIELNSGFKPFSIILLGSFIYVYLSPFLTKIVILDKMGDNLQIVLLYIGIFIISLFINEFELSLMKVILINLILDMFIVRLLF